jgi:hypothetical protein
MRILNRESVQLGVSAIVGGCCVYVALWLTYQDSMVDCKKLTVLEERIHAVKDKEIETLKGSLALALQQNERLRNPHAHSIADSANNLGLWVDRKSYK